MKRYYKLVFLFIFLTTGLFQQAFSLSFNYNKKISSCGIRQITDPSLDSSFNHNIYHPSKYDEWFNQMITTLILQQEFEEELEIEEHPDEVISDLGIRSINKNIVLSNKSNLSYQISVFDLSGKMILNKYCNKETGETRIPVMQSGMYFITVHFGDRILNSTVTIK